MNTMIDYMYRDGSNYKQWGSIVLTGSHTEEEKQFLLSVDEFIASEVGLESLQFRMISFPSDDDHVFHEIEDVSLVETEPNDTRTVAQFIKDLKEAPEDVCAAMEYLGI